MDADADELILTTCDDCGLTQTLDNDGFVVEWPDGYVGEEDGDCRCLSAPAPLCVNCGRTARMGFDRCEPCAALRNGRNPGRRRLAKTDDGLRVKTWDPERWNPANRPSAAANCNGE